MSRKDLPKITTEEIAKQVAEKLGGVSKKQVKNILNATKEIVAENLKDGKVIQITGFFSVAPQYRGERLANNIVTKQKALIPESVGVSIKAGTELKSAALTLDPEDYKPAK